MCGRARTAFGAVVCGLVGPLWGHGPCWAAVKSCLQNDTVCTLLLDVAPSSFVTRTRVGVCCTCTAAQIRTYELVSCERSRTPGLLGTAGFLPLYLLLTLLPAQSVLTLLASAEQQKQKKIELRKYHRLRLACAYSEMPSF